MIKILLEKFFYLIIFLALCMPNHSSLVLFGVTVRDILLIILLLVNIIAASKFKKSKFRNIAIFLFFYCFINELIIKKIVYPYTDSSLFYSFRMGLPFFIVILMFIFGFNFNIIKTWKAINLAVIVSGIITIFSLFFYIPILAKDDLLSVETTGRVFNDNSSIGLISIYILINYKNSPLYSGIINKLGIYFGIGLLLLSFNRTLLFCSFLIVFLNFLYSKDKVRMIKKYSGLLLLLLIAVYFIYNNFPIIQAQMDERIFYLFDDSIKSNDRLFENNRDIIYYGIVDAISRGFWLFGMPYSLPIFHNIFTSTDVNFTDTSLINILLRFGIIALLTFLLLYWKMIRNVSKNDRIIFYIFLFASLNVDILFRHVSILFIFLFWFFLKNYSKRNTI